MVQCMAIASHLLAWGQLRNQAGGQVSPFVKHQYFLNNLISEVHCCFDNQCFNKAKALWLPCLILRGYMVHHTIMKAHRVI